jgi:hypothetical protein
MVRPSRSAAPPRWLVRLVHRAIRDADVAEMALGDAAAECEEGLPGAPRWRVALWYARTLLPVAARFACPGKPGGRGVAWRAWRRT